MAGYTARCSSLGYSSFIKIDGRGILPPLIDDEYQAELLHYKHLAVLLESRCRNNSNLHGYRGSIDSGMFTASGSEQTLNNSPTQLMSNSGVSCEPLQGSSRYDELMFTDSDLGGGTESNLYSTVSNIEAIDLKSLESENTNVHASYFTSEQQETEFNSCGVVDSAVLTLEESSRNVVTVSDNLNYVAKEELQTSLLNGNVIGEVKDMEELQTSLPNGNVIGEVKDMEELQTSLPNGNVIGEVKDMEELQTSLSNGNVIGEVKDMEELQTSLPNGNVIGEVKDMEELQTSLPNGNVIGEVKDMEELQTSLSNGNVIGEVKDMEELQTSLSNGNVIGEVKDMEELQTSLSNGNVIGEVKDMEELQTSDISSSDRYKPIEIATEVQCEYSCYKCFTAGLNLCVCFDIRSEIEDNDVSMQSCNTTSDKGKSDELVVGDSKSSSCMLPLCIGGESNLNSNPAINPSSDRLEHFYENNNMLLPCLTSNVNIDFENAPIIPWKPLYTVACTISNIPDLPAIYDDTIVSRESNAKNELIEELIIPSCTLSYTTLNIPQQLSLPVSKSALSKNNAEKNDYGISSSDAEEIPISRTSDSLMILPSETHGKCVLQTSNLNPNTALDKSFASANDHELRSNGNSSGYSNEINHCSPLRSEVPTNSPETDPILTILDPQESAITTTLEKNKDDGCITPVRFVRRNSYTLDAPSPVLLAHLEAEAVKRNENTFIESKTNICTKQSRKGWNLAQTKADWDSEATTSCVFAVACKQSQMVRAKKNNTSSPTKHKKHTKYINNASLPSSIASSPVKINFSHGSLDSLPDVFSKKHQHTPSNTKWSPVSSSSKKSESTELHHKKRLPVKMNEYLDDLWKYSDTASVGEQPDLKDLFIQMQLQHSQQMAELLTKQKLEQEAMRQAFLNQQDHIMSEVNIITPDSDSTPVSDLLHAESDACKQVSRKIASTEEMLPSISARNSFLLESAVSSKLCSTQVALSSIGPVSHKTNQSSTEAIQLASPSAAFCESHLSNSIEMIHCGNSNKRNKTFLSNSIEMIHCGNSNKRNETCLSNSIEMIQSGNSNKRNKTCLSNSIEMIHCGNSNKRNETFLSNSIEMIQSGNSNKRNETWCSRQLFQDQESDTASLAHFLRNKLADHLEMKQKERAASIINAAVRGYLTRRLLKTEYVQERINTITDTVHCAIQLQQECPVDLQPSDVELHRRLIQQLTAACHALHDTFFEFSISERMALIAADRERLRIQLSKPPSNQVTLSLATQRTLQRKQLQLDDLSSDRSLASGRKVWNRSKGRASSAGHYEVSANCTSKQHQLLQISTIMKPQRPASSRTSRRPWR